MSKNLSLKPRLDFVLVKRVISDTTPGKVAVGNAYRFFVEAVSDGVKDLKKGDRVILAAEGTCHPLPSNYEGAGRDDLFFVDQKYLLSVVEGWE
jgi:NADPH:quinone reductase-like Zn-dependent oxidoreductase